VSGLACLSILAIDLLGDMAVGSWPLILGIVGLATGVFFVPSAVLGMVSPLVAKLAVRDLDETGSTVGKIYAAGSVGAIVGTFATGFFLISWFGTRTVVWGVALALLTLGTVYLLVERRRLMLLAGLVLVALVSLSLRGGWLQGICTLETNYFCIKVEEQVEEGKIVRVLILDRLVHSYTSLEDPTTLVYVYERMYAEATAYLASQRDNLRALFIGGGGYTFPRYMETLYPNSQLDVIEIDPGVTRVAHELLGLSRDTSIVTYNEDARLFLERAPDHLYDLILGDAFNDFSVPYHLTTREFNDRVRAWLTDDGMYLVNIIDGPRGDFLRAYLHTLRQSFEHVYVAPTATTWRQAPRSTFVVIGTGKSIDRVTLHVAGQRVGTAYLVDRMLSEGDIDALLAEKPPILLTDQYAPVDQMLAPLFRDQASDVLPDS
jgi:spermidine synthase